MFFHWGCTWIRCSFHNLTRIKWSIKINKKWKLLSNKGLFKTFIKLMMYTYTIAQLWINCIFMVLLIYFSFEAQIIHIVMCKHFDHLFCINNEKKNLWWQIHQAPNMVNGAMTTFLIFTLKKWDFCFNEMFEVELIIVVNMVCFITCLHYMTI